MTRRTIQMGLALLIGLGLVPTLATNALADDEVESSEFAESGTYMSIGAVGGMTFLDDQIGADPISKEPSNLGPIDDDEGPTYGISARVGHRTGRYFAWELEYLWISGFKVETKRPATQTFDVHNLSWSLKGYPLVDLLDPVLGGRIAPYVAAGVGYVQADNSGIDTPIDLGLRFAAGSDFHIDSSWSVYAEVSYRMTMLKLDDLDYLVYGLGVAYHFE